MTARQLQARVRYWQRELPLLGLTHWRIEPQIADEIENNADDEAVGLRPIAHCEVDRFYDSAKITVRRDQLGLGQKHVDELIVHELLHTVDRDRDEAEESLLTYLSQDARGGEESRVRAAREKSIDRVARQIVALHG